MEITDSDLQAIRQFATTAEEYCSFFRSWQSRTPEDFLREAHRRLPGLYAAALDLPDVYSDPIVDTEAADEAEGDEADLTASAIHPDLARPTSDEWMAEWRALGKHLGEYKY